MEGSFTGGWYPDLTPFIGVDIPKTDHVADPSATFFAVAFDRRGRLGWKTSRIVDDDPGYGNAHIIEVLCESAPASYLAYLQNIGVSYIFAGESEMDLPLALAKLKALFGIHTLLLEGGSILNGVFQREGIIDELSLVIAPVTAQANSLPLFENGLPESFGQLVIKQYDGALWLNYRKLQI